MSLFALDSADRPEAENLVAVLLRRSNIEKSHRDTYMVIFQRAWEIIRTITIGDMQLIDKLANKDIHLLGQWVTFLADMFPFFKKIIEEEHRSLEFSLAIKSAFSRKLNQHPKGFIAEINLNKIHISLVDNPKYESYKTLPAFKNKEIDERRPDEQIWYKDPNSTTNSKLEKRELNIKFCDTLERSRMHQLTLDSWRIELLSNWLQRHFGSNKDHSVETTTAFLGDSGKYACRLLRELTRADIVVSIYKKDYRDEQSFLKIVSEDSDDPQILSLLDEHQDNMETIGKVYTDDAKAHSLCYKSVYENRFIYEQTGSLDQLITQAYLDYQEPQSVMILPLHMEHRLIGVIEIKGSQRHHFRWSHRLRLQQVASVIAPYFYRQHLLQSLSKISFLIIKHRFSAKDVFGERSIDSGFFSDVCQELCQIFLSRTANIWLLSAQRSDKFVLSGHSDESIFDNTKRDYDGNISFIYTDSNNMKVGAEKHFLYAFSELYDKQGISVRKNKIVIKTPNLFKVGRFYADDKRETVYGNSMIEQGVIRLNQDWLELDPSGKRRNLFEKRNFQEIMTFPLTLWNDNLMVYEVIGFVSLQNDRFSNFSQDWRHTIKLVNDQIVIALEQIGYINKEEALIRKTMFHETKEEASFIIGQMENYEKMASFVRFELEALIQSNTSLPQDVINKLKGLKNQHNKMRNGYEATKKSYKRLHIKLDNLSNANVYAFLDIDPDDIGNEEIDMYDIVQEAKRGYVEASKKKGMHFDIKIKPSLTWRTDRECLLRILQNLLDNATKYALDHSTIEIIINNTCLTVKNRCLYDSLLDGVKWPFSPGKRGKNTKNNIPGWGYGLCSVQLFSEKILNWKCKFSQSRRLPESNNGDFSITITRRL
jgi:hypothetical protein